MACSVRLTLTFDSETQLLANCVVESFGGNGTGPEVSDNDSINDSREMFARLWKNTPDSQGELNNPVGVPVPGDAVKENDGGMRDIGDGQGLRGVAHGMLPSSPLLGGVARGQSSTGLFGEQSLPKPEKAAAA